MGCIQYIESFLSLQVFSFVVKTNGYFLMGTFQVRLLSPSLGDGVLSFLIISEMAPSSLRKTFLCSETSKRLVCLHLKESSHLPR